MVRAELDDLVHCRKKLFIYRMTIHQGYTRWFHLSVDFSNTCDPDRVVSEYELPDWQGSVHAIRAEGRLIDGRFVCFFRDFSSKELSCVYLFPRFCAGQNKPSCGVCLHQTWDQNAPDCLSRAIIHDKPVAGQTQAGLLDDASGTLLDELWEADFLTSHLALPKSLQQVEAKPGHKSSQNLFSS